MIMINHDYDNESDCGYDYDYDYCMLHVIYIWQTMRKFQGNEQRIFCFDECNDYIFYVKHFKYGL